MADKVVDASALAAIIFAEPEAADMEARLKGHGLMAPTLLPFEMSSICLKKLRAHESQRDAILARFARFPAFPIELASVAPKPIIEIADTLGLSAYDASYLLLAVQRRAELVTLDVKLNRAAAQIGAAKSL